ncbi:MAG: glycosyltransferase family 2 protein [Acidobacteria bacterium]|nr:glycosyltransferase family 2 protein [Acidobacteriota bacterium]
MKQSEPGVSACFPAFNDAGSIAWVAHRAREALESTGRDFEILILDDGSVDQTGEALQRLAREIPELRTLRHEENRGYGATLRDLFAAARFPLVVYTDGDGQFDPFELTRFLDVVSSDVQLVNGFRRKRADGPLRRLLGPRFHRVIAETFGLPALRDWDCDFRLFRRDLEIEASMTFNDGTAVVEFLAGLEDRGIRFAEVEVSHSARRAGASQYFRPHSVVSGHRNLLRLWRKRGSPPIKLRAWWSTGVR